MQLEKLNSQSGIVLILAVLWVFTLSLIMVFGMWIIKQGINPTNAIVTTILGVLVGTAFGSVNGAFFTSITGDTPSQDNSTVITSKTSQITSIPTQLPLDKNNAPSASPTQGTAV